MKYEEQQYDNQGLFIHIIYGRLTSDAEKKQCCLLCFHNQAFKFKSPITPLPPLPPFTQHE